MTDNNGAGPGRPSSGRPDGPDLIDDALRLVDSLQRKLLVAGVKRGVSAVTNPPPKDDVWEEAIRMETTQERPPLEEFVEIVRRSAPEVAGHLGRAGMSFADAVGRTWGVVERSFEQGREEAARARADREARERADRERDARAGRESPSGAGAGGRGGAQDDVDKQVKAGE
ncbi:hypothetical protein GCM10007079_39760 [Nocardiopsis terrae]|uniref:PE family protein n=1 Tax=Nocardiopsis terrae TaxID=372655 RepID=A0ABR9HEA6_9ACTN|nr:hypothetical protein [Nocardiopsis terrae]MBE1457362.1 hypothetical protein [Nocardiopsis terrae]GHC91925.1 hypothetical protein GCM10007079_39760 [Nocardiopsis terrae]